MRFTDLTPRELEEILTDMGEPSFRAKQVYSWLCSDVRFSDMSNIPARLRERLKNEHSEGLVETESVQVSSDGTKKFLFRLYDMNYVESVLMRYDYGNTVCISSQAGCAMGCRFCASTKGGLIRNLSAGEMLAQVIAVNAAEGRGRNIKNVVLMGTGEPFANYENTIRAIKLMRSEDGLNISARNISVSTCGVVPGIKRFADEKLPVTLCLSLHSAFDKKRKLIMPIAQRYTVRETIGAMREYQQTTGRRVIFEYILIKKFNDSSEDVSELKKVTAGLICHLNIIPYNHVDGLPFRAPSLGEAHEFASRLNTAGVSATVRRSLGQDIDGACGQLRARAMQL